MKESSSLTINQKKQAIEKSRKLEKVIWVLFIVNCAAYVLVGMFLVGNNIITTPMENVTITVQPKNYSVPEGESVILHVEAEGSNLQYRWQFCAIEEVMADSSNSLSWKNITSRRGWDSNTLRFFANTADAGSYRCLITNADGKKVYSRTASVIVQNIPEITKQPVSATVTEGEMAVFHVEATGSGLTYQWQYKDNESSQWKDSMQTGNDAETVYIKSGTLNNGREYRCEIRSASGESIVSDTVVLTVEVEASEGITVNNSDNASFYDGDLQAYVESKILSGDEYIGTGFLSHYDGKHEEYLVIHIPVDVNKQHISNGGYYLDSFLDRNLTDTGFIGVTYEYEDYFDPIEMQELRIENEAFCMCDIHHKGDGSFTDADGEKHSVQYVTFISDDPNYYYSIYAWEQRLTGRIYNRLTLETRLRFKNADGNKEITAEDCEGLFAKAYENCSFFTNA